MNSHSPHRLRDTTAMVRGYQRNWNRKPTYLEKISLISCSATLCPRLAMKSVEQGGLGAAEAGCCGWPEAGEPAGDARAGDGIIAAAAWETKGPWCASAKGGWNYTNKLSSRKPKSVGTKSISQDFFIIRSPRKHIMNVFLCDTVLNVICVKQKLSHCLLR